jgi:hypothetical protein
LRRLSAEPAHTDEAPGGKALHEHAVCPPAKGRTYDATLGAREAEARILEWDGQPFLDGCQNSAAFAGVADLPPSTPCPFVITNIAQDPTLPENRLGFGEKSLITSGAAGIT